MIIRPGIIFIWTGLISAIPSGWVRDDTMNNYFPKGTADGVNPNATGGASTHSHTSPSHSHTMNAHTHTITIGASTNWDTTSDTSSTGQPLGDPGSHSHAGYATGGVVSASVSSNAATYSSISNNPPYHKVIYITPSNKTNILPEGVISLADAELTGFYKCDGSNSTPNLVNKFLLGASLGAEAGATGGSTTNVHNLSHVHTTSHSHSATTSGGPVGSTAGRVESGTADRLYGGHTHVVTPNTATPSSTDNVSLTTAETVEPAYTKLLALYNQAQKRAPIGIIALWKGTLVSIPRGWKLCDGSGGTVDMRDRHLKITATLSEVGNTGGSNTHTHASQNHSHTISHNHSAAAIGSHSVNVNYRASGSGAVVFASTRHDSVTVSTDNMVLASSSTTANSSSNEPIFKTVAFIKLKSQLFGASFFNNFVH